MQCHRLLQDGCRFRWRVQSGLQGFLIAIVEDRAPPVRNDGARGFMSVDSGSRFVVVEHDGRRSADPGPESYGNPPYRTLAGVNHVDAKQNVMLGRGAFALCRGYTPTPAARSPDKRL